MSDDFLSRWSRRKVEARKGAREEKEAVAPASDVVTPANEVVAPAPAGAQSPPEPLPPISSLTPESDFTPFMKSEVDPQLKRDALKTLFKDPRYNVMDGLDVYIDDYSKPDPLPEGWLEKMTQTAFLGDYKPPVEEEPELPRELGSEWTEVETDQGLMSGSEPHLDGADEVPLPPPESKEP